MRPRQIGLLLLLAACRTGSGKVDDGSRDDGQDSGETTGENGDDGSDGDDDGTDGADDGTDGADGSDGEDGSDGSDGEDGSDGSDGSDGGTTPTESCNGLDDDGDGDVDEDGVCPDDVTTDPATGHAYMPASGSYNWPQAVTHCQTYGYYLVILNDSTENDLVWDLLYDGYDGVATLGQNTWIGYHDDGSGFAWVDGSSGGYEAFSGDVTTETWGTANYGQAAAYGDFEQALWHEVPGSWVYAAMCESDGGS